MKFADESDRASHLEELEREHHLTLVRNTASQRLQPRGTCHFCEDYVPDELIFCDIDCREQWQRVQDAWRRNGGA